MCLVVLYLGDEKSGDSEQVVLASNRDEFFSRPSLPSAYYTDPDAEFRKVFETKSLERDDSKPFVLLGPKDIKLLHDRTPLHGSPLLVGSGKRWAVLTNALTGHGMGSGKKGRTNSLHEYGQSVAVKTKEVQSYAINSIYGWMILLAGISTFLNTQFGWHWIMYIPLCMSIVALELDQKKEIVKVKRRSSRGQLLVSFVNSQLSPEEFAAELEKRSSDLLFEGFSMIVGVGNDACFVSNRPPRPELISTNKEFFKEKLEKGRIYGLSNTFLDDSRGKIKRAMTLFEPVVRDICHHKNDNGNPSMLSEEERNKIVHHAIHSVMGDCKKCDLIPTWNTPEDEHIRYICVPKVEVGPPFTKERDFMGCLDTFFMTISFDEETDEKAGLDGHRLYQLDRRELNPELLVFDDGTHQETAKLFSQRKINR